jgi:putative Mg2+ transporter-C (MgtC) family protein
MTVDIGIQFDLAIRLLLAVLLGGAIGVEREFSKHPAGLRTLMMVSLGSCLFSSLGIVLVDPKTTDPTRIAAQVVTGIGFLGAGAILRQGDSVKGLTTAASIWVVASIGMACGFGLYVLALLGTILAVVALVVVGRLEDRFLHKHTQHPSDVHQ